MSYLYKPWYGKPPIGAQINRGHPLAQGLIFCALLNEGAGSPADLIRLQYGTLNAGAAWGSGPRTISVPGFNTTDYVSWPTVDYSQPPLTVFCKSTFSANSGSNFDSLVANASATGWVLSPLAQGNANLYFLKNNVSSINSTIPYPLNVSVSCAASVTASAVTFMLDGVFATVSDSSSTLSGSNPIYIGAVPTINPVGAGNFEVAYIWNRALTADELMSLYINPYQMLQGQSPRYRFSALTTPRRFFLLTNVVRN